MWKLVLAALLVAHTAHADAGDRWDGVMIVEQSGGAVLGGAVGMLAGGGLGMLAAGKSNKFLGGLGEAILGAMVGGVVGVTAGVQVTGDARGGNGLWYATAGGTVAGGVLFAVTASQYAEKLPWQVSLGLGFVTVLAPPIIAYHLTSDANASDHEARVMVPLLLGAF